MVGPTMVLRISRKLRSATSALVLLPGAPSFNALFKFLFSLWSCYWAGSATARKEKALKGGAYQEKVISVQVLAMKSA